MERMFALAVGIVFVLVGLLGFIPGVTTADGMLMGLFAVDGVHNVFHLLVGLLGIAAYYYGRYARLYCQVLAVVYLLIGILGFIPGITTADGMLLGLIHVNLADNLLHLIVGGLSAFFGFAPQFGHRPSPTA